MPRGQKNAAAVTEETQEAVLCEAPVEPSFEAPIPDISEFPESNVMLTETGFEIMPDEESAPVEAEIANAIVPNIEAAEALASEQSPEVISADTVIVDEVQIVRLDEAGPEIQSLYALNRKAFEIIPYLQLKAWTEHKDIEVIVGTSEREPGLKENYVLKVSPTGKVSKELVPAR